MYVCVYMCLCVVCVFVPVCMMCESEVCVWDCLCLCVVMGKLLVCRPVQ